MENNNNNNEVTNNTAKKNRSKNSSTNNKNTEKDMSKNNESGVQSNQRGNNDEKVGQTAQEKVKGVLEEYMGKNNPISKNIYLILIGFVIFLLIIVLFFFSSSFRNQQSISSIKAYHRYQSIKNHREGDRNNQLSHFQIASAFNPCNSSRPVFDYTSTEVLKNILQAGARYLDVKIFNESFSENTHAVVSNGSKQGQWKLTLNNTSFDDFCKTIHEHAFNVSRKLDNNDSVGVNNFKDPLFIGLDLATGRNLVTLNKMAKTILKYFSDRLLSREYRNISQNLADIKMKDLEGKIVFFSSDGYEGSQLRELINATWDGPNATIEKIHYFDLLQIIDIPEEEANKVTDNTPDQNEQSTGIKNFIQKTANKLVIVVPDKEGELNIFKQQNYNPTHALNLGCQFVSLYYQSVDEYMNPYITKFKNYSVKLKPPDLRTKGDIVTDTTGKDPNYDTYRSLINSATNVLKDITSKQTGT
jgi:hypothetical protein